MDNHHNLPFSNDEVNCIFLVKLHDEEMGAHVYINISYMYVYEQMGWYVYIYMYLYINKKKSLFIVKDNKCRSFKLSYLLFLFILFVALYLFNFINRLK